MTWLYFLFTVFLGLPTTEIEQEKKPDLSSNQEDWGWFVDIEEE